MSDSSKGNIQPKAGKKANIPLILALGGVLISMFSESIKDERRRMQFSHLASGGRSLRCCTWFSSARKLRRVKSL